MKRAHSTRKLKRGLLLAPGAGADSNSPALVAIEDALANRFVVRRMDFPYRKAGRRAPDRQPVLLQAIVDEANAFEQETGIALKDIYFGGRSMGGRICSIAVAEGLPAAGLVLISYPLHPPGRPDRLRVEHFTDIGVPALFVSGTRDAFGSVAEIKKHTRKINGDVTQHWIDGGDHGLRKYDAEVAETVSSWLP